MAQADVSINITAILYYITADIIHWCIIYYNTAVEQISQINSYLL